MTMARESQRRGRADGSREFGDLKKINHVSGGNEGLEGKEVPGGTGFWPHNRCRRARSPKTRVGPGPGDRGLDVFGAPRCQVDRRVYWVDQGAMAYKQPHNKQEASKALGEEDVKGWGMERGENSRPAGVRAIKEDCRGEVREQG